MSSEALSPADRSSLAAEQGAVNMAVGGVLILDGQIGRRDVFQRVQERIHLVPRLRQRLEAPAMGLANPLWVDDAHFDLEWHLRSTTLPSPGEEADLEELVGRESSRLLDRTRPLWEMTVVEGLSRNRTAVLMRLHHALVDGLGALALGMLLVDPTPEPLDVPPPERDWTPQPLDRWQQLARTVTGPISQTTKLMRDGVGRALDPDPLRTGREMRRATELLTELARNRPQAPMTPLNQTLGANRRWRLVRAELDSLKRSAKAGGGTVNDAILAAVAGMMREYLEAAGATGRQPVALVPVSVRREGEQGGLGNRISTVLVDLPTDLADPQVRLQAVSERMSSLKDSAAVRAGALMVGASGAAPPLLSALLARALSGVLAFNLVVSNIPGPQQPLYMSGLRVRAVYPVVPLNPANQRLSIGVFSYDGGVYFGLLADRDLEPGVDLAAQALRTALAELVS